MDLSKYRRYHATIERMENLVRNGRCPACELLLTSKYHTECVYLDDLAQELINTDILPNS